MGAFDNFREFCPRSRGEWRRWLERNHASKPGVWLVYWKQATGRQRVTYGDAVEEALCFGWIDSKIQPIDAERYRQVFTPRKAGSAWSKLNKTRVAKLEAAGLIAEPGMAAIERARRDGTWAALDAVESAEVPEDLAQALEADPIARAGFEAYSFTWRKVLIRRVVDAVRAETRARRVAEVVRIAATGKAPNLFLGKKPEG